MLLTLPVPFPGRVTLRVYAVALNVAVTAALVFPFKTHGPVPLQAPDHPTNFEFVIGIAVSVAAVPRGKLAMQPDPQLMPLGELLTVPLPELLTVSTYELGGDGR
jgi:uncharacterized membrane protein AbrB (regulator of aidB expression)